MKNRELPTYEIGGTVFIVDVANGQLMERLHPENVILFDEMNDKTLHYEFLYDHFTKNRLESGTIEMDSIAIQIISVPQMTALDPQGMADKYEMTLDQVIGKSDFEVMVDPVLLQKRLSGQLPIIEIAGHPFYVDLRMDTLRPHDDFSTPGLSIRKIEDFEIKDDGTAWVPYDPITHQVKELDWEKITEIPNDCLLVEIPFYGKLDPVGFARKHDLHIKSYLRQHPIIDNQKAKIVPWQESNLPKIIERNKEKLREPNKFLAKSITKRKRGKRF